MQKPEPGELLALRVDRARPLFEKWLRDEDLSGKIAALAGVIEQYKLVAAGHGGKKETPTPEPESASEAGK